MSSALAPTPTPKNKEPRRKGLPWLSEKPETRSVQIGILGSVLINLLLILLAPRFAEMGKGAASATTRPKNRTFRIQLAQQPPPKPKPKAPQKFVETNPNAPENIPNDTNNFSDRNQQVAQEKKGKVTEKTDKPQLDGRKDIESNQIVTGQLTKPEESVPTAAPVPTPQTPPSTATPQREQNPLSGFDKSQGSAANGFASNIAKPTDNEKLIPNKITGSKDAPIIENPTVSTPQIDPRHPQPRRTLDQHVRPAIFTQNDFSTSNIGPTAYDAKWSNYGVYLHKLIETVQIEWDSILENSKIMPNSGNVVSVKFIINSKGEIFKVVKVDPSGGTSEEATQACVTAITARSPYGDWTADMIAMLGTEQEMTFTFYYQ